MSFEDSFGLGAFNNAPTEVPAPDQPAATWSAVVNLGGSNVSASITGAITVEGEESTARIAKFKIKPADGNIDVKDWTAAAVTIDYVPGTDPAERIFTGKVQEPVYDPETKLVEFTCTDNLQGYCESKTEAQLLALMTNGTDIVGRYSKQVFGERVDGWRQAEDILQTIPAGFDLLVDGVTPSLTAWEAIGPTVGFNASNAVDISIELVRLRDLINSVTIKANYRFSREHHRENEFFWQYDGLCDFVSNPYELPTREMWQQASFGTNWINKAGSICHVTLPKNGVYCNGQGLSVSEEARRQVVISALWRGVRRWTQTVTEQYEITVREAGSIAAYGLLPYEDAADLSIENDDATWNASVETGDPPAPSGGTLNSAAFADCGSSGLAPGENWVWTDKVDETERVNLLLTLIQAADRKIRETHRANFVSWRTWIQPGIERSQTMQINAGGISAVGKVVQFRHVLSVEDGSALTSIKIACHKCPAGGSQDALDAPAKPDTESGYSNPPIQTLLSTYIGFQSGAAAYDEDWIGFTTNRTTYAGAAGDEDKVYPVRIRVDGPNIEDAAVDEIQQPQVVVIDTLIGDETLTVTV